jgi:hypothetical protein
MIIADCSAIIFYLTDDGPAGRQVRDRVAKEMAQPADDA